MMEKQGLRGVLLNAAMWYTLTTLALSASFYIIEDMDTAYAPTFGTLLCILAASAVYGASVLLFDIKTWTSAQKRISHFCINLVSVVLFSTVMRGEFVLAQEMAAVFVFIITYFVSVGLRALVRRFISQLGQE